MTSIKPFKLPENKRHIPNFLEIIENYFTTNRTSDDQQFDILYKSLVNSNMSSNLISILAKRKPTTYNQLKEMILSAIKTSTNEQIHVILTPSDDPLQALEQGKALFGTLNRNLQLGIIRNHLPVSVYDSLAFSRDVEDNLRDYILNQGFTNASNWKQPQLNNSTF